MATKYYSIQILSANRAKVQQRQANEANVRIMKRGEGKSGPTWKERRIKMESE